MNKRTHRLQYFCGFIYVEPFSEEEGFWVYPKEVALFVIEADRVSMESGEDHAEYDSVYEAWLM